MPAQLNNIHALKWTKEMVMQKLASIAHQVEAGKLCYLGTALLQEKLYRRLWSYWQKVYKDDDDVMPAIFYIETMLEAHLFQAALEGAVTASVAIFALKNNHKWSDRPEPVQQPFELTTHIPSMVIELGDSSVIVP